MPNYNFESVLPYPFLFLLVLLFFYGVYFTKMLIQKKHGIQTHQIGRRKEKGLHTVETLMSVATFSIVPIQILSVLLDLNRFPDNARFTGFLIAILGDILFLCAVLNMKNSWRAGIPDKDKTELVTDGIYAFSRNPAFLGFDLQYIGTFFMYANILTAIFTLFCVIMLHLQILQEEKYLSATFGEPYELYRKKVFRYLGRKSDKN